MMTKKSISILVTAVVLSLIANVFFGRWLSAKISTWPVLNRFKILSPQTPIVINQQQVVRTSDATDLLQAAGTAKSKLATVGWTDGNGNLNVVGAAVALTSDGLFVTGSPTFAANQKYFIILNDGTTAPVTTSTPDSVTGLVFFKAPAASISPADLGNSNDLLPGEKILFLQNSPQSYMDRFAAAFVSQGQSDSQGLTFDSDKPSRAFGIQTSIQPISGEAVVNLSGQVVGIYNGSSVISSDVLNNDIALYLNNPQKIIHPQFGFNYSIVTKAQSNLTGIAQGALVKDITKPKISGNLQSGDVITSVDGNSVSETNMLEPLLQKYKPGDTVNLVVMRNKQQIKITFKVQ